MTLAKNSENVYFLSNSVLSFRKSYQIWGKLAQEQKSYRQKINWGWKTPPVLIGLRPSRGGHSELLDTGRLVQEVEKETQKYPKNINDPKISANFSKVISITQFIYHIINNSYCFYDPKLSSFQYFT